MRLLGVGLIALLLAGCASALRWGGDAPEGHYEVRRGDTLYSIAMRHDLDWRDLAQWNGISRNNVIYPGQMLRLRPSSGSATRVARAPGAASGSAASGRSGGATGSAAGNRSPSGPASSGSAGSSTSAPSTAGAPSGSSRASGASGGSATGGAGKATAGPRRWQWPVRGSVLRRFGPPESKGIDIGASEGTPVRAAAAGSVVYSGSALKGYGELIIIKHDDTWLTAYGYNRRRRAQEGQRVAAGEVIGEVGLGPERKPMLHFEIRKAGQPTDPLRLLPRGG